MPVRFGNAISYEVFKGEVKRIFASRVSMVLVQKMYNCVKGVVRSGHGGVLVFFNPKTVDAQDANNEYAVAQKVRDEANRLCKVATGIDPVVDVNADVAATMSSIDGAMLMDVDCKCYAIGVILDGIAGNYYGDKSRGSRFNSSERYAENKKDDTSVANASGTKEDDSDADSNLMVVVVSEDGMVDIFPRGHDNDSDDELNEDNSLSDDNTVTPSM